MARGAADVGPIAKTNRLQNRTEAVVEFREGVDPVENLVLIMVRGRELTI